MKVTFIGLGKMGMPMASNLVKSLGTELTVVNRSRDKVRQMVKRGAQGGTSPLSASREADIVCLCLSGEETIENVLTGADGVLKSLSSGGIVMDHSTVDPEFAKRMADVCAAEGIEYLDAPVSGTGIVAWEGRLTVMVGGSQASFNRVKPVLELVSGASYRVGPVGSGNVVKLINNMIGDINQVAVMEGFVLAAALGVDLGVLFEALSTASASSRQLARVGPKILSRDFEATSSLNGHVTNQAHTRKLCEQVGLDLPLRTAVEDFWHRGANLGLGPGDPTEAIKLLEAQIGITVRRT